MVTSPLYHMTDKNCFTINSLSVNIWFVYLFYKSIHLELQKNFMGEAGYTPLIPAYGRQRWWISWVWGQPVAHSETLFQKDEKKVKKKKWTKGESLRCLGVQLERLLQDLVCTCGYVSQHACYQKGDAPRPTHPVVSIYPLMIKGQVWKLGMRKSTEKPAQALHPEFVQKRPRPWLQHFCSKDRTEPKASTWRSVQCCAVTSAALSASRED